MDVTEMDQTNKQWGKKRTETKQRTCVQMESCFGERGNNCGDPELGMVLEGVTDIGGSLGGSRL